MNMSTNGICKTEGCSLVIKAKGLCSKHHQQWYRAKNRTSTMRRRKVCSIVGCEKLGKSTDMYCRNHQRKFELYGDPLGGRITQKHCSKDGCTGIHLAKGLCKNHYALKLNQQKSKLLDERLFAINQMVKDPVWDDLLKLYTEKKNKLKRETDVSGYGTQ